ncbi:MAG TPA: uroporphyrinogen-III C-methyltransferase [Verrucomicrobiae bacterium]|jgi:uroporphyrinogen III methyltransferase/synthase|nr:uroporphyrinogen-III C-methyltransferase [Verrucomicrobiae bacterium]
MKQKGMVYLVGAGPGDAGLLTLRGAELLKRADVVVYDALVNTELLRLASKTAEIIYGGKRAREHAIPQEELNRLLIKKAKEGKTVVRLKGGDPYVFGRGGEEAEELHDAGIPFEVVPGVSSITAAANYAGIPITHRSHSSSFTVVTGHENPAKDVSSVDWAWLSKEPGTKVILMGVERIREIASELIRHGLSADTPVGMVRWGTRGRQSSIDGTLATIADLVEQKNFGAPAITIIGGVVKLRPKLNWFEKRPLFGQSIVVTRTREQAGQLARQLHELGADVLEIPTIKTEEPQNKSDLMDAMLTLGEFDWIVFTSPNGVDAFFGYFFKGFDDIRALGNLRIAAVGPATAARLKELHLRVDAMPEEYVTVKVAEAISSFESIENLRILLMRAEVANQELPQELERLGAIVDDVACYRTVAETEDVNGSAARLSELGADWVTFTSSSTVENFNARFNLPRLKEQFPGIRFASIGPETSKTLRQFGVEPDAEAREHNIPGLIKVLREESRREDRTA